MTSVQKSNSSFENKEEGETPSLQSLDHLLLSSAASCISFDLMKSNFRPVFTHQLFDNETIRGYQPTNSSLEEVKGRRLF